MRWVFFCCRKEAAGEFLTDGDPFDPCSHFEIIDPEGECTPENFDKNTTVACQVLKLPLEE